MKTKRTYRRTGRNCQGKHISSGSKTAAAAASQAKPSPLGSSHIKLLIGKIFYLDLPSNASTESLERDIKELGGTVEKFFSKDIKYLVSNKKEARYVNGLRQTCPVPSPDSGQSSPHPGSNPHKPCSHGDNVKGRSLNPTDAFVASRGKSLVDRVVNEQERVHTSKILSNALEWGVKIIYVDDLRAYIQKKKKGVSSQYPATVADRANVNVELAAKQPFQKCKGGRITKPFVKVEDSSRHYRPIYITLPNMPQFNLRGLPPCSPFLADDKDSPGERPYPHRGVKASGSEGKAQNGRKKKRSGGYCECCMVKYENVTRHLLSDCHQAFCKGDQYAVLDKVISRMHFNFSSVLKQVEGSSCGASSVPKQRHKEDFCLAETVDRHQWSSSEGPCVGQDSKMAPFPAAAAPNRGGEEEKSDDTGTDGSRSKSSGLKQMCGQDSPTSHTPKSSQPQMEATLPPGFNVRTDHQETTEEFAGKNLPKMEELSIPTQTFSPVRKIKRKSRVYKRKRQKFESHVCVKPSVTNDDSKLKLWEIFESSDGMDVEFQGFKGLKQGN
eukprot:XP_011603937.1 PREDICTED: protein DBF4 homolog A isoform X1 [Takifugu rubripes]